MITEKYAKKIIECLNLKPNEEVVLIEDSTTKGIIEPVYKLIKNNKTLIDLDVFERPLDNLPEEISNIAKRKVLCFYALEDKSNKKKKEFLFRRKLVDIVENSGGRIGNLNNITEEAVKSAFSYDLKKIKDLTQRVLEYFSNVKKINVKSSDGTDAVFEFSNSYNWIASTGFIEKGKTRNVMPAEVFTYPANVNGRVVIDGVYCYLTYFFKNKKEMLEITRKNPIEWYIKEGKIIDVKCKNKEIEKMAKKAVFESCENSDRIGEYGMGTNIGIKKYLGIVVHDEKYPSVHLAHGDPYSKVTGAKYESKIHFDGVLIKPSVINLDNNEIIMEKGVYRIFQ